MANALSILRMVLSLTLLLVTPLGLPFYIIYSLCGITDMLDGPIARRTGTASKLGEKLDTIGDLIFMIVVCLRVLPLLSLKLFIILWCIIILLVRLASITVVAIKHKTFAISHTVLNKLTGFLLFVLPFMYKTSLGTPMVILICTIASVAATQELWMQSRSLKLV